MSATPPPPPGSGGTPPPPPGGGTPPPASPPPPGAGAPPPQQPPPQQPPQQGGAEQKSSNRGCLIAAAVVIGLVLLAIIAFFVMTALVWNTATDSVGDAIDEANEQMEEAAENAGTVPDVTDDGSDDGSDGGDVFAGQDLDTCLGFSAAYSSVFLGSFGAIFGDDEAVEQYQDQIAELRENVPSEIEDDFDTVATAYQEYFTAVGEAGFTDPEGMEDAQSIIETDEVTEAEENIETWLEENC